MARRTDQKHILINLFPSYTIHNLHISRAYYNPQIIITIASVEALLTHLTNARRQRAATGGTPPKTASPNVTRKKPQQKNQISKETEEIPEIHTEHVEESPPEITEPPQEDNNGGNEGHVDEIIDESRKTNETTNNETKNNTTTKVPHENVSVFNIFRRKSNPQVLEGQKQELKRGKSQQNLKEKEKEKSEQNLMQPELKRGKSQQDLLKQEKSQPELQKEKSQQELQKEKSQQSLKEKSQQNLLATEEDDGVKIMNDSDNEEKGAETVQKYSSLCLFYIVYFLLMNYLVQIMKAKTRGI